MARLPYVTPEQLPESERDLFDDLLERFGRVNNIFRVIAHSPPILRRLLPLGAALRHATQLDPVLRELAILTVGRLTQCTYEVVHHSALAQRLGVRPDQIERLAAWESDPAFTAQERAVIRYAAEATQQVTVSTETFEALRSFLSTEHIVELVCNVAFYNMVVRVLIPLEVDLEEDAHVSRYKLT
jgi:uncharacterized peroxidase-related enzyme